MPGGHKPKSKRGEAAAEVIDPKLSKVDQRKMLNKLGHQRRQGSNQENDREDGHL